MDAEDGAQKRAAALQDDRTGGGQRPTTKGAVPQIGSDGYGRPGSFGPTGSGSLQRRGSSDSLSLGSLGKQVQQGTTDQQRELMCVLDVAYAKDKTERISIYSGDEASAVAAAFAKKHGIQGNALRVLEDFISRTMQDHIMQKDLFASFEDEHGARSGGDDDLDLSIDEEDSERPKGGGRGPSHRGRCGRSAALSLLDGDKDFLSPSPPASPPAHRMDVATPASAPSPEPDLQPSSQPSPPAPRAPPVSSPPPATSPPPTDIRTRDAASPTVDGGGGAPGSSSDGGEALYNRLKSAWKQAGKGATEFAKVSHISTAHIKPVAAVPKSKRGRGDTPPKKKVIANDAAFARLYREAEAQRKRHEDLRDKRLRDEEHARKSAMWTPPKSAQRLTTSDKEGLDVGTRLYEKARVLFKERDEAVERGKEEAARIKDWVCPKCSFMNNWGAESCLNVIGRSKALVEELPTSWIYVDEDVNTGRDNEVIRCGQPRPELFQPTIVSLQDYQSVYMSDLPASVKFRPENIHLDLYGRRVDIDQRHRNLCCQRWDEERLDCTFHPEINDHSKILIEEKERLMREDPDFELNERTRKKAGHHHCTAESHYTFKPDIGVNHYWSRTESDLQLVERLAVQDPKFRQLKVDTMKQSIDSKLGPFRPEITTKGMERQRGPDPVSEYLYEYRKVQQTRKEAAEQKVMDEIKLKASTRFTKSLSRQLVQDLKLKAYERIFRSLFPDPSRATTQSVLDVTEASFVDIHDPALASVLRQVLWSDLPSPRMAQQPSQRQSPRQSAAMMNFAQFVEKMDVKVPGSMAISDLLNPSYRTTEKEMSTYLEDLHRELTFTPMINPRSEELVRDRYTGQECFVTLHEDAERLRMRQEERARKYRDRELDNCTFVPKLIPAGLFSAWEPRYHYPNASPFKESGDLQAEALEALQAEAEELVMSADLSSSKPAPVSVRTASASSATSKRRSREKKKKATTATTAPAPPVSYSPPAVPDSGSYLRGYLSRSGSGVPAAISPPLTLSLTSNAVLTESAFMELTQGGGGGTGGGVGRRSRRSSSVDMLLPPPPPPPGVPPPLAEGDEW